MCGMACTRGNPSANSIQYDAAQSAMRDRDVRDAMLSRLWRWHEGDPDTRVIQEMGIWSGTVRIDIAVINGEMSGFELKSDSDTLTRLPAQAELYSRVFDRMTLVVGERHAEKSKAIVPSWWGVTVARQEHKKVTLTCRRKSQRNPSQDAFLVAQLLWREEALRVLDSYALAKGWRSKTARAIHERLASVLPLETLNHEVRTVLKSRQSWLGQLGSQKTEMPVDSVLCPSSTAT